MRIVRPKVLLLTAVATISVFVGYGVLAAAGPTSKSGSSQAATRSVSFPSAEQCWAKAPRGNGGVFISPCREDEGERFCHDHLALGVPACIPLSPEEKAEAARIRKFTEVRLAGEARQKALREAEVQNEIRRLGIHREAEIRNRLRLKEEAQAARSGSMAVPPRQGPDGAKCISSPRSGVVSSGVFWATQEKALSALSQYSRSVCDRGPKTETVECRQTNMALPGRKANILWECSAKYQCSPGLPTCGGNVTKAIGQ